MAVATLSALFFQTIRKLALVVLYLLLLPYLFLFINNANVGLRMWFYQIATISLLAALIVYAVKHQNWFSSRVAYLFLILIIFYGILAFSSQIRLLEDIAVHKLFLKMQDQKITNFYVNDDLIDVPLEYYFEIKKNPYQIYRAHLQGELDVSQSKFQYYILKKGSYDAAKFTKFNLIVENDFFDVYESTGN